MFRYGMILFIICFCASLVLSVTYKFTHSRIEAQQIIEEKNALGEVFPEADKFEDKTMDDETYYVAKRDNRDLGYVSHIKAKGYAGIISMLVGFDFKGEIKGIKILSQEETPGLGAKINEVRFGEKKPWFLQQFEGRLAGGLDLRDIQAITGATISSKAVLEGVKKSVADFLDRAK